MSVRREFALTETKNSALSFLVQVVRQPEAEKAGLRHCMVELFVGNLQSKFCVNFRKVTQNAGVRL